MKNADLVSKLNHYGYDLLDVRDKPGYEDRKSGAWAVMDRRTGRYACVYVTKKQVEEWLNEHVVRIMDTL